jgi:hypothetical protein
MGVRGLNFPPPKRGFATTTRARAKGGVDRNRPKIDGGEIKLQNRRLLRSIYCRICLINGVFPDGKK